MVTYGGDEVSALVVSPGSSTFAAGYAGEDTPKAVFPASYGFVPDETGGGKIYVGDEGVDVWRRGMEVGNPMRDGMVDDPESFTTLLSHALHTRLRVDPTHHPLLLTEPAWNSPKHRETLAEIAFEKFGVPGFYVGNESVLSAFAAGRGTALILDIGETQTSSVAVVDGFVLRKSVQRQPLGGQSMSAALKRLAPQASQHGASTPHHLIASKTPVDAGQPPRFTLREDRAAEGATTATWRMHAEGKVVREWREAVGGVLENGWNDVAASQRPYKAYEFPNGYNQSFGPERFKASEILFNPSAFYDPSSPAPLPPSFERPTIPPTEPNACVSIAQMLLNSVLAADADVRAVLLGNIVLVGGASLTPGLADRVAAEVNALAPGNKIKIHSPANTVERRFAPWLGGSILASLGTFHQLWISQDEWREVGRPIVGMRCK